MQIVHKETAKGQRLLAIANTNIGTELHHVYRTWSAEKQSAFDRCYREYAKDNFAEGFHICTANTNKFSVSWESFGVVILITATNKYMIF